VGCNEPVAKTADGPATRDSIVAMARLEPLGQVVRVAAGEEGVLQRLVVAEGDVVKKGDPIGYLASYPLRQQELRTATLKLERRGLSPLEIEAQAARVRLKEAEAAHYRAEVERQKGLVETGLMPGKELDATVLLASKADEEAKGARADLKHLEGSVTLSRDEAEAELARAKILLERAVILSPIDGEVLKLLARPGEKVTGPIVQMGATRAMTALAEVHANDVHLVQVNQRASFTSAALPGPVEGKVTHIGALIGRNNVFGEDPAAPDNARVFEVTVLLDDSTNAARFTNLEGQVRIFLKSGR
jgi:HlyD family secretion protein